jgi:hypothetical protein
VTDSVRDRLTPHDAKVLVVDANLLVLLVVGSHNRDRISTFKRTKVFTAEDFDCVQEVCEYFARRSGVLTTPHILTEVSNLLGRNPGLQQVFEVLVSQVEEVWTRARDLVTRPEFISMGLADTGILDLVSSRHLFFTTDWDLSGRLDHSGASVINYNHLKFQI